MCALQMQAEYGPTLGSDAAGLEAALEKFMVKQILTSRPRQEWLADVAARYRALAQFSKDDARIQYLRIIRSLPYGNSIFFTVKVGGCGGVQVGWLARVGGRFGSPAAAWLCLAHTLTRTPHPRPARPPLRSASRTRLACCRRA